MICNCVYEFDPERSYRAVMDHFGLQVAQGGVRER